MYKYFWVFIFSLFSTFFVFALETDNKIKGAACFVSDDQGRVLVTRDILTNKIAIPGGYIGNDTPEQAAKRETLEETGIAVKIVGELARMGSAVLFDCKAISPIPIHNRSSFLAWVSAWQSEHFGREVRGVYMMSPRVMALSEVRFPDQVSMFSRWMKETTHSETAHVENFENEVSPWIVWHAKINHAFQNVVQSLPEGISLMLDALLKCVTLLGSGGMFFLLLPFAMASGGLKRAGGILFTTVLVTLVVGFAKLSFAVPRPFYIYPDLQLSMESGFAFPSGHAATAFAVWGWVYIWMKSAGKSSLFIWLIPGTMVALSRIYLGVHYLGDVFVGSIIGVLSVGASYFLYQKDLILKPAVWLALGGVALPLALTQIQPVFAYCAVFALVFSLILQIIKSKLPENILGFNKPVFLLSFAGLFAIMLGLYHIEKTSNVSMEIILSHGLAVIFLTIWLSLLSLHYYRKV